MGQADAREGRPRHEDYRDGGLTGMTETVETTENEARPIPASIPTPDHPIRHTSWWQLFVRLPRPAPAWVTVGGIGCAMIFGSSRPVARRVGKEGVSTGRPRWYRYNKNK